MRKTREKYSNLLFKCVECFHWDYKKRDKLFTKELKFKKGVICMFVCGVRAQRFFFQLNRFTPGAGRLALEKRLMPKWRSAGVGGCSFSTVLLHESHREMQELQLGDRNNGVSDLQPPINKSHFQASALQTGVLRVPPPTLTLTHVLLFVSEFPRLTRAKG